MINWFPGHMAKANRDIIKMQRLADLFIIVLDARAPLSTLNENLDDLAPKTPRLIIVAKSDLCDNNKKDRINKELLKHNNEGVFWLDLRKKNSRSLILKECKRIFQIKKSKEIFKGIERKSSRIIVLGVPNSGKSTLINLLAGKKIAKTANKPGVTRIIQWVNIGKIQIMDTPGILWPKFDKELIGIKLALIGAIDLNSVKIEDFSYDCLKLLTKYYPKKLAKLNINIVKTDLDGYNELYKFAKEKKWISKDNNIVISKAMKYIINYTQNIKGITFD